MRKTPNILRIFLLLLVSALLMGTSFGRVWTRQADGKKLPAIFVGLEAGKISLKLSNGRTVQVPMETFTKADQVAAKRFAQIGDDTLTQKSAQMIDKLLAQGVVKTGLKSFNEPLPDDLFVRRVYLDIIGRIPTRREFLDFVESPRKDKREALIDSLLTSPGYSSHMFNYFADTYRLHGAPDLPPGTRLEPYIQWWKESLANNKPYDQLVTEMITASGNVGQNPAAGFLIRDAGMEFDAFSNFSQVMMGIDISCAQCHDHPFDDWTIDQFYEMAAFFGQTQRTLARYSTDKTMAMSMMARTDADIPNAPEGWRRKFESFAEGKGIDLTNQQQARKFKYYLNNALGYNIGDNEEMVMPVPESIEDIGGEVYKPRVLLGKAAKMSGKTRREALAAWLTSPENPRFALAIANRMWDRAFGRPLIDKHLVNDFPVEWEKHTAQPKVAAFVAKEMQRVGYDLREFSRILYNTKVYQTYSTAEQPGFKNNYAFQGPILRRLRAEQAWDSLMVLASGDKIDAVTGRDGSFYRELLNVDFENVSMPEMWERYQSWNSNYRLLGSGMVEGGTYSSPSTPDVAKLSGVELIRASEMQQPAPGGSLVDSFGQSDRFVTDDHTFDGTVPQVLALMNGVVTQKLTGSSSKIVDDLEDLDAPEDKVRAVYFTMLSRFPTDDEQSMGVEILDDFGDDGIRDLAWALMNSPEFLFIQ